MSSAVVVHKGRTNTLIVDLRTDITGDTITSEIRAEPNQDSLLIATWTVTVDDASLGLLTLTLDDILTDQITAPNGYMDLKRVSSGEPIPVFDRPLEVEFRGTVTE